MRDLRKTSKKYTTKDRFGRFVFDLEAAYKANSDIKIDELKSGLCQQVNHLNHRNDFKRLRKLVDKLEREYK